jgi:molybdopterin molybdotransferase
MLSCEEAIKQLLEVTQPLGTESVALTNAIDRTLAETIHSDIDSPPFDKALMDGFAIVGQDLLADQDKSFSILGEIAAGQVADFEVASGTAARIMTGAPMPHGADSVVMIEKSTVEGDLVRITDPEFGVGQNVMKRAESLAYGQPVLTAPRRIRAMEVGLLAEVGRSTVNVISRPSVSTLATGSELVDASEKPSGGQIRNSNGPLLSAWCNQLGAEATSLGIAKDNQADLAEAIKRGLQSDVLLLSGGVSAGDYDLVPKTLGDCGVQKLFHKVSIKPGKPIWAGIYESGEHRCVVVGLPGNPVSTLVCFQVFVRPVLCKMMAAPLLESPRCSVTIDRDHRQRGDRPTYWPAKWHGTNKIDVELLPWLGSADLRTLIDADLLVLFPEGRSDFSAGESLPGMPFPA